MNEKKTSISPKQISKIILIPVLGIIFLGLISMTVYGFSSYRSESEDEGRVETNTLANNQPDGTVLRSFDQTGEQSSDESQASYSKPAGNSDATMSQITNDFQKEINKYPEPEDIKKDIFFNGGGSVSYTHSANGSNKKIYKSYYDNDAVDGGKDKKIRTVITYNDQEGKKPHKELNYYSDGNISCIKEYDDNAKPTQTTYYSKEGAIKSVLKYKQENNPKEDKQDNNPK